MQLFSHLHQALKREFGEIGKGSEEGTIIPVFLISNVKQQSVDVLGSQWVVHRDDATKSWSNIRSQSNSESGQQVPGQHRVDPEIKTSLNCILIICCHA